MARWLPFFVLVVVVAVALAPSVRTSDQEAPDWRRQRSWEFHVRAQLGTGLLVPMYVYPANIHANAAYNRLMDLKRQHPTVPMWVILNPASGPGAQVDANYAKAIDRLRGAGCVVLGYVTTSYGKRPVGEVRKDIDQWLSLYPAAAGIFFDEMAYQDTDEAVARQVALNDYAGQRGYWPTVGNPGAETPGRYFAANASDVIVVHEGDAWPADERMRGDYFGGYSDFPPYTRAVLLHSQPKLDEAALRMARKYAGWVYVTDDAYRVGDPRADNPWDALSRHLPEMCRQLER